RRRWCRRLFALNRWPIDARSSRGCGAEDACPGSKEPRPDSLGEAARPPEFPSRCTKRWHTTATVERPAPTVILQRNTEIGEQSGNKAAASGVFGYAVACNFSATRVDMRFSLAQPRPEFHFYCGLVALLEDAYEAARPSDGEERR